VLPAVEQAAAENAAWCALVCATHGIASTTTKAMWWADGDSPDLYPDVCTLHPATSAAEVLDRISPGPRRSVKDSFASIDLAGAGFGVLFVSSWVGRRPDTALPAEGLEWRTVDDAEALAQWAEAHGGGDVFRPELLASPDVAVVAVLHGDALVGGGIGHRSDGLVGLSNVFSVYGPVEGVMAATLRALGTVLGPLPVVGYESGDYLDAALALGFELLGPLRVWGRA
jgi:hypothetical protein